MAEVTGHIGDQPVELNNAATEATLKLLLASSLTANKNIVEQLKKLAINGGVLDARAMANVNTNLNTMNQGVSDSGQQLFSFEKALQGTIRVAHMFESALGKLSTATAQGSDMFAAFKDFPKLIPGLGAISDKYAKLLKFQEENMQAYQKLTTAGVNFAGDLGQIREAAGKTYMTLDQFADLTSKNSDVFARMGVSANDGAKSFVNIANQFQRSDLGKQLKGLGLTTQDLNEGLLNFARISGGRTRQELETIEGQKALQETTADYLNNLQGLSKLTGDSKEAQEKRVNEIASENAFQIHLAKLRAQGLTKQADQEAAYVANMSALSREQGIFARATALHTVTTDKATLSSIGLFSQAASANQAAYQLTQQGKYTAENAQAATADVVLGIRKGAESINEQTLLNLDETGAFGSALTNQLGIYVKTFGKSKDEITEILKPTIPKKGEITSAQQMANVNDQLKEASLALNKAIQALANDAMPTMVKAINAFTEAVKTMSGVVVQAPGFFNNLYNSLAIIADVAGLYLLAKGGSTVLKGISGGGSSAGATTAGKAWRDMTLAERAKAGLTSPAVEGAAAETSALAKNASKILKGTAVVGTALTVGLAAKDYADISLAEKQGKISAAEAGTQKGGVVGGAGGALAGGLAGGAAGAEAGAAIGALFGGVGAAPGALIGGLLGGAGGALMGSDIGKSIGEWWATDSKEDSAKAEEKAKEEKTKQDAEKNKASEKSSSEMQALNSTMQQILKYIKDTASNTERTYQDVEKLKPGIWK